MSKHDQDLEALLSSGDDDDESAGADIEESGAEESGADLVEAGADLVVSGADIDNMVEIVSGMVKRGTSPARAISLLPPAVQRLVAARIKRQPAPARTVRIVNDKPKQWFETEEGFGPVTVTAGNESTEIVIQPDVYAFRPKTLFVEDDVASFFQLTYFYVGRHNALMGSGRVPCTRFKSTATTKLWRLPTLRSGGRLILKFRNKDAADHDVSGSVGGLFLE
jgi:hypothetical protein